MRLVFTLVLVFAWSVPAVAGTVTTELSGTFNNSQENACIHVSTFFYLTDCFYSRHNKTVAGQELPWSGPTVNPVYYSVTSPHAVPTYVPVPGDDRIAPPLHGTVTVDDHGTSAPDDDTISGRWIVGPAARSVVVNVNEFAGGTGGAPPRAVMTWSGITHTLAPTRIDSATPNDHGGFDYVIGSKGFPERLCLVKDPGDCFPSAHAGLTTDGQTAVSTWDGPKAIGITRDTAMEGNIGATTEAVIADYTCVDNRGQVTCPNHNVVWSPSAEPAPGARNRNEGPGFDNLVLKVVTNARGKVIAAEGYWTNEYFIMGGPKVFQVPEGHNNSFQGGYLQLRSSSRGDR
ncbi:MAG: hypothetical protein R3F24_13505 [Gammaproteobacteria bacterium]